MVSLYFRMKKFLVTILSILYITVSSGATINIHYCMGKAAGWDFSQPASDKCDVCGMHKSAHKGCCKDTQKVLQIDKDQKASESFFHFVNAGALLFTVYYTALPVYPLTARNLLQPIAHAPPGSGSVPDFIRFCNFRI